MKRTLTALLAFFSLITLQAHAQTPPGDTLIDVKTFNERDVTVGVPTVRRADGTVCVGYIQAAGYDTQTETTDVRIGRICGMPRPGEVMPAQLQSIGNFAQNGMLVQTPNTTVSN
ncbi:hypothetical protein [Paraburkholderia youngii]|uniref:hypothetical protein n=1 Tax=Paraburkholderia youngii TaxID=2782701 RepID=UPI003D1AA592